MSRMHVAVQVRCLSVVPAATVALLAGSSLSCDIECLRHSSEKNGTEKDKFCYDNSDSENEDESPNDAVDDKAILKVWYNSSLFDILCFSAVHDLFSLSKSFISVCSLLPFRAPLHPLPESVGDLFQTKSIDFQGIFLEQ